MPFKNDDKNRLRWTLTEDGIDDESDDVGNPSTEKDINGNVRVRTAFTNKLRELGFETKNFTRINEYTKLEGDLMVIVSITGLKNDQFIRVSHYGLGLNDARDFPFPAGENEALRHVMDILDGAHNTGRVHIDIHGIKAKHASVVAVLAKHGMKERSQKGLIGIMFTFEGGDLYAAASSHKDTPEPWNGRMELNISGPADDVAGVVTDLKAISKSISVTPFGRAPAAAPVKKPKTLN